MKNFLILGLLALLLFSVSAALSLWLNQSPSPTEDKGGEKDKAAAKKTGEKEKESTEPRPLPKVEPGPATGIDPLATAREQEKLKLRSAQMELVLADLRAARGANDALLQQVTNELKTATARSAEVEAMAKQLEAKKTDTGASERANIIKMAAWYDAMAPESAAPILKQMADSGNMDTAVKILANMKERQVAQVFAALNDAALAAQLFDRMQTYKSPAAAPLPGVAPAVPVPAPLPLPVPAGGVPPVRVP